MWPAADEKRKNSLQMTHLLMLIVIAVCLLCIIFSSWNPRRRALEEGEPGGSVWHHIQQYISCAKVREPSCLVERGATPQPLHLNSDNIPQIELVSVALQAAQVPPSTKKKPKREFRREAAVDDEIQFSYPNRHGTGYVNRRITVWAVDADYLEGYCHAGQGKRTFSLQHIRGKVTSLTTGEIQSVRRWASERRLRLNRRNVIDGVARLSTRIKDYPTDNSNRARRHTTAYFVGFRNTKRCELEAMARAAGWQVRTEFSASVDVLITGQLAGRAQLGKADSMKIDVISESDFRSRLEDH
jgi:NAD-dependent DNA ligase